MPTIFLSPYKSNFLADGQFGGCSSSSGSVRAVSQKQRWPFDSGDDPSFFCRHELKEALTWGVCRADVRSQVHPGDVVVFFSFTKRENGVEYRLSALATVERKIRQSDIFFDGAYHSYQRYRNLLVRPDGDNGKKWEHYEPGLPKNEWHKDWLSRIVPFKFFSKDSLIEQAKLNQVSLETTYIDGKQFRFGSNYVLFSTKPSETLVVGEPPVIAHAKPPSQEVWRDNRLSREIFKRTIEKVRTDGVKRGLRLDNKIQQPHSPPLRAEIGMHDLQVWRHEFIEFLLGQDLGRC